MDLTMQSFQEIKKTVKTVLLPIGMMEAHGPHCSLGTDVLIPRELIKRLNKVDENLFLIGAEIPYGHSWGLRPFDGTIDISSNAFSNYVYEIGKEFHRNGFERIILFNGHGGNIASLQLVSEKLSDLGLTVLLINWWMDYREEIINITPGFGHAGEDETSMVLAINQSLANTDGLEPHEIPISPNIKFKDGGRVLYPLAYSGDPGAASAEKGELLYRMLVPLILKDIKSIID
ncbi:creatininase family protein [Litchfieldia alkalitelluris]|uniref:creatininase family protein n=1 Tax=Litchfieldia alkalitelluris TaxID=304268 RepID=UPI00195DF337|nr:creatininase family protein [Litchfieldia alkalitelluris]